jgi:hypothetical protein
VLRSTYAPRQPSPASSSGASRGAAKSRKHRHFPVAHRTRHIRASSDRSVPDRCQRGAVDVTAGVALQRVIVVSVRLLYPGPAASLRRTADTKLGERTEHCHLPAYARLRVLPSVYDHDCPHGRTCSPTWHTKPSASRASPKAGACSARPRTGCPALHGSCRSLSPRARPAPSEPRDTPRRLHVQPVAPTGLIFGIWRNLSNSVLGCEENPLAE